MTDETKTKIRTLLDQGVSPRAIAKELRVTIDDVLALKRGAIGRAVDAVDVARTVPEGRALGCPPDLAVAAQLSERLREARPAQRDLSGLSGPPPAYRPDPLGGKRFDGSPAPHPDDMFKPRGRGRRMGL